MSPPLRWRSAGAGRPDPPDESCISTRRKGKKKRRDRATRSQALLARRQQEMPAAHPRHGIAKASTMQEKRVGLTIRAVQETTPPSDMLWIPTAAMWADGLTKANDSLRAVFWTGCAIPPPWQGWCLGHLSAVVLHRHSNAPDTTFEPTKSWECQCALFHYARLSSKDNMSTTLWPKIAIGSLSRSAQRQTSRTTVSNQKRGGLGTMEEKHRRWVSKYGTYVWRFNEWHLKCWLTWGDSWSFICKILVKSANLKNIAPTPLYSEKHTDFSNLTSHFCLLAFFWHWFNSTTCLDRNSAPGWWGFL